MMVASRPWQGLMIATIWLLSYLVVARYFALALPFSLTSRMTLSIYLWLVHTMTGILGVLLVLRITRRNEFMRIRLMPWSLASTRLGQGSDTPSTASLALALGMAPAVYVAAHAFGMALAYRTLLAELAAHGSSAVQRQSGALGRAAAGDHLWTLIPFTVIVAPLVEELLFRGVWFGSIQTLFEKRSTPNVDSSAGAKVSLPASIPGLKRSRSSTFRLEQIIAWLGSSLVFGLMHADTTGGMGIMRTASSSMLGLACGYSRMRTGKLVAPIVLHAAFNLISLSNLRGWLRLSHFPTRFALPTVLLLIAPLAGTLGYVCWFFLRKSHSGQIAAKVSEKLRKRTSD